MSQEQWIALISQIEAIAWLVRDHGQRGEWVLTSYNARQLAELALEIQHYSVEQIVKECTCKE